MRSRQQNVRQRAASKQVSTEKQKGSWDTTADGGYESTSSGNSIPMFNPLHVPNRADGVPPPPGSYPPAWKHTLIQAPGSLEGLRSGSGHLPPLTPDIIPDSSYQAFLLGQSHKRKGGIDTIFLAKFCAVFSWVAIMLLVFIGILIDTQPVYIQGVMAKHEQYGDNNKMKTFYDLSQSERLPAAKHAYQAAFFYFLLGSACLAYAYNLHWRFKSHMRQYHDVPDTASTAPSFHAHGSEGELPTFSPAMKAYEYDNGIGSKLWNVTRVTTNRVGIYISSIWPRNQEHRRSRRRDLGTKDV